MALTTVPINDRTGTERDIVVDDFLGGTPTELLQLVRSWRHKGAKHTTQPGMTSTAAVVIAARTSRITAVLYNSGPNTVYLSESSGVTTATGLPLAAGASITDDDSNDAWYGICAASQTATVIAVEVY